MERLDTVGGSIEVEKTEGGARYLLRRRGTAGGAGPAQAFLLAVFGLVFSGFAVFMIFQFVRLASLLVDERGLNFFYALFFVFSILFGLVFVLAGQIPVAIALWILMGRTEIVLTRDCVQRRDFAGPYRWTRRRSQRTVRRYAVRGAIGEASGGREEPAVLVAECERGPPLTLVFGYPRAWLDALANDLSIRSGLRLNGSHERKTVTALACRDTSMTKSGASERGPGPGDGRLRDVQLSPVTAKVGGWHAAFTAFDVAFACLWNVGTWAFILVFVFVIDADKPLMAYVVLGIFALIGLVLGGAALRRILRRRKLSDPTLRVSVQPLALGETFTVRYYQVVKSRLKVKRVSLTLVLREDATRQRGTTSSTYTKDVIRDERDVPCGPMAERFVPLEGEATFRIPADAMHTFHAPNNEVYWLVETHVKIPWWPDDKEIFEIEVLPVRLDSEEGDIGGRTS